jgi:tRNA(fMet)-specific endonuclease VapC
MALFLLDSDTTINYINRFAATLRQIGELLLRGETLCTNDVVLSEVYAGLYPEDEIRGGPFLEALIFLPQSRSAAERAGRWRFEYARRGVVLSTYDVLIAAAAVEHNATVVTGNVRHYPMREVSLLPLRH